MLMPLSSDRLPEDVTDGIFCELSQATNNMAELTVEDAATGCRVKRALRQRHSLGLR